MSALSKNIPFKVCPVPLNMHLRISTQPGPVTV